MKRVTSFFLSNKTIIFLLLGAFGVYFFPLITLNQILYCCDNFLINIPIREFFRQSLAQGIFPLWNPHIFSGIPYVADINLSPLYPWRFVEIILGSFISPFEALTITTLFHILLGLLGMYYAARRLGLTRFGATVSAFIFAFSGTLITYTNNLPMIQVASLLPLVLGLWITYKNNSTRQNLINVILFSSLQVLAGHPQLTFYSWLLYVSYALIFFPGNILRRIGNIGRIASGVCLVTAIQLLPFLEFVLSSTRIGNGFSYATFGSLPLTALMRFFLPTIVGNTSVGTGWWQGGSVYGYVGVLPLIVALFAIRDKRKIVVFFVLLCIFSFLMSFGSNMPIFRLAYFLIPGVSLFRVPSHFLLLNTVATAILAGWGSEYFLTHLPRRTWVFLTGGFISLVGGCFLFIERGMIVQFLLNSSIEKVAQKIASLGSNGTQILISQAIGNICFVGITLLIVSQLSNFSHKNRKKIFLTLIFLDLFLFSRMGLLTIPRQAGKELLISIKEQGNVIPEKDRALYRIFVDPRLYQFPSQPHVGQPQYAEETVWQAKILRPNTGILSGLSSVDGYGAMIYQSYQRALGEKATDPTGIVLPVLSGPILSSLGMRYIFVSRSLPLPDGATGFRFAGETPTSILLENTLARPILRLEKPNGSFEKVTIRKQTAQSIEAIVDATESGTLVFATTFYPGWRAMVNNSWVQIRPYEEILQSIPMEKGTSTVRFSFEPWSVKIGAVLSVLGIVVFSIFLIRNIPRPKKFA